MKERRIYLASPYSSPDAETRALRYQSACYAASAIMKQGCMVFSPIVHSHPLAPRGLPGDFDFWQGYCLSFLRHWATHLFVCKMDGWQESVGVRAEIEEAKRLCLPVIYINPRFLERQNAAH